MLGISAAHELAEAAQRKRLPAELDLVLVRVGRIHRHQVALAVDGVPMSGVPNQQPRLWIGAFADEEVLQGILQGVRAEVLQERDLEALGFERLGHRFGVLDPLRQLRPTVVRFEPARTAVIVIADDQRLRRAVKMQLFSDRGVCRFVRFHRHIE